MACVTEGTPHQLLRAQYRSNMSSYSNSKWAGTYTFDEKSHLYTCKGCDQVFKHTAFYGHIKKCVLRRPPPAESRLPQEGVEATRDDETPQAETADIQARAPHANDVPSTEESREVVQSPGPSSSRQSTLSRLMGRIRSAFWGAATSAAQAAETAVPPADQAPAPAADHRRCSSSGSSSAGIGSDFLHTDSDSEVRWSCEAACLAAAYSSLLVCVVAGRLLVCTWVRRG